MSRTHSRGGCTSELCIKVGVVVLGGCASSADEVLAVPVIVTLVLAVVFVIGIVVMSGNVSGGLRVGGSRRGDWGGGGCCGVCMRGCWWLAR